MTESSEQVHTGTYKINSSTEELEAQLVLEFLRKRGLENAVLELQNHVELKKVKIEPLTTGDGQNSPDDSEQEQNKALETLEKKLKIAQTPQSTGYDLDAAPILPWVTMKSGDDATIHTFDMDSTGRVVVSEKQKKMRAESMAYFESFLRLQSWVLSLPDDQYLPELDSLKEHMQTTSLEKDAGKQSQNVSHYHTRIVPASCKFELLSVCFPLFVHTYCDLLECGLEQKALHLFQTYRHIYEPTFSSELRDLQQCNSMQIYLQMNRDIKYASDVVHEVQVVRSTMQARKQKRKEVESDTQEDSEIRSASLASLDEEIQRLESAMRELSRNAITLSKKLQSFPFLQKAAMKRSQICVSQTSHFLLSSILNKEALFPMCAMLQSRCYLAVQRREPLPYIPNCVFQESVFCGEEKDEIDEVSWAAPVHPILRAAEAGEDTSNLTSILNHTQALPFPKLFMKKEYESLIAYDKDRRDVEFNRALLINGFRRLEAIEIKTDYENGTRKIGSTQADDDRPESNDICNPLSPSILLATLCSVTAHSNPDSMGRSLSLEASHIGIICAKMCPPDGRRVASGCDDSAIRIWSMEALSPKKYHNRNYDHEDYVPPGDASSVLLGHKNGFAVYDVDWNRDGRTLLSSGGDGTLRLWDTMAVGSFGRLSNIRRVSNAHGIKSHNVSTKNKDSSSLNVPGERAESLVEVHGAALACYRGHSLSTPVWSAAFAPCGYYFASAGSDSTARLWCTDRPAPIRIFSGHFSPSVNNVTWHPNCNYILSSGDDKTARMWDIQTGRCIRILSGASSGIGIVKVCPSGRYAAGADYSGIVHIWELGSGKKVNELRHTSDTDFPCNIQSLCYSSCGTALATGCDDNTVRIWDAKGLDATSRAQSDVSRFKFGEMTPVNTFKTRQTPILDLQYSKRNLLFAVGKYT